MNHSLKITNRTGIVIAVCFAIGFLATLHLRPYSLAYLVKAVPIFILSFLVLLNIRHSRGRRIALGLLFSAIGDIVLELNSGDLFVFGILAFSLAHLFYISAFFGNVAITWQRNSIVAILLAYACILGYLLFPELGGMLVPIAVYLGIILLMAVSAVTGRLNHPLIMIGACLFLVSDSIIAVNRYLHPVQYSGFWIMTSYYAAQALIAAGSFKSRVQQTI